MSDHDQRCGLGVDMERLEARRLLTVPTPTFDPAFAGDGRLEVTEIGQYNWAEIQRTLELPDGGVLLVGEVGMVDNGPYYFPVGSETSGFVERPYPASFAERDTFYARLSSDGTRDVDFGGGNGITFGKELISNLPYVDPASLRIAADGDLLGELGGIIFRFNPDFTTNSDFHPIHLRHYTSDSDYRSLSWDEGADGRIVLAWSKDISPGWKRGELIEVVLAQYDHDGVLQQEAHEVFDFRVSDEVTPEVQSARFGQLSVADDGSVRLVHERVEEGPVEQAPERLFFGVVKFDDRLQRDLDFGTEGFGEIRVWRQLDSYIAWYSADYVFDGCGRTAIHVYEGEGDMFGRIIETDGTEGPGFPDLFTGVANSSTGWTRRMLTDVYFDGDVVTAIYGYNVNNITSSHLYGNPIVRDSHGSVTSTGISRRDGAEGSQTEHLLLHDADQPVYARDSARLPSGDLILGGYVDLADIIWSQQGWAVGVNAVNHTPAAWKVQLEPVTPPGEPAVIDFDDLPLGQMGKTYHDPAGLTLREVSPGGSALTLLGSGNGYASNVLQPSEWSGTVALEPTAGGTFSLSSFDYAADQWSEAGDFTVIGTFADGAADRRDVDFSSKTLRTLELDWNDLTRVVITYRGGINNVYGAIDNIRFTLGDPDDAPATTVGFEQATLGVYSTPVEEGGYEFRSLASNGQFSKTVVYGPGAGYASNVLSTVNWGESILVTHGGASFDLDRFELAAGRWGEAGDATIVGRFVDGSRQTLSAAFSNQRLSTVELDWDDLTSLRINFGGGMNSAYGVVDNLVFA